MDKERVAIDIGVGQIIELDKTESKLIYNSNTIIAIFQIISSLFIFYMVILFEMGFISIEQITFRGIKIGHIASEFFYRSSLLFFGICLSVSGAYMLYLNSKFRLI